MRIYATPPRYYVSRLARAVHRDRLRLARLPLPSASGTTRSRSARGLKFAIFSLCFRSARRVRHRPVRTFSRSARARGNRAACGWRLPARRSGFSSMVNAVNFMDGANGLAMGSVAIGTHRARCDRPAGTARFSRWRCDLLRGRARSLPVSGLEFSARQACSRAIQARSSPARWRRWLSLRRDPPHRAFACSCPAIIFFPLLADVWSRWLARLFAATRCSMAIPSTSIKS